MAVINFMKSSKNLAKVEVTKIFETCRNRKKFKHRIGYQLFELKYW